MGGVGYGPWLLLRAVACGKAPQQWLFGTVLGRGLGSKPWAIALGFWPWSKDIAKGHGLGTWSWVMVWLWRLAMALDHGVGPWPSDMAGLWRLVMAPD